MNRKNTIIAVLCILLIASTSLSYHVYQQQQQVIDVQENIIEKLIRAGNADNEEKQTPANVNMNVPVSVPVTESESGSCANIVAVRSDTHSGVMGKVHVELKEGKGNVLVNTNPFVESTTQYSVREAVRVAENYTNINITNRDIIVYFDINGTLIGGPSAGAAITAATIAAIENKEVRQDAAITGTIEEGGRIGQVGGVFEKAVAAEENGMELFLVPMGQKKLIYYEQEIGEREIFGFTFTRVYYTPKEIDLGEYMKGKMEAEEVSTIDDVVAYMVT
ncbi:MAG: S16 family serine protease [Euryarchaeota archaeon]|nr:S16 family serine protease [Euryarchaeota archaeon]